MPFNWKYTLVGLIVFLIGLNSILAEFGSKPFINFKIPEITYPILLIIAGLFLLYYGLGFGFRRLF